MELTKEELDKVFTYDSETGVFTRKAYLKGGGAVGTPIGWADKDGYLRVNYMCKTYALHRLAFVMMGEEVPLNVDHINGKSDDNRWCNLRPATISQNSCNRKPRCRPKSGYRGVTWVNNKWSVKVKARGVSHYGGRFIDKEEAYKVACALRVKLHGEFARHD